MEWLVAQGIWQQSILGWSSNPKAIGCWASKEYEIDIVTPDKDLIEFKRGKASPIYFGFPHPGRLVCCRAPGDCAPFDNGPAPKLSDQAGSLQSTEAEKRLFLH